MCREARYLLKEFAPTHPDRARTTLTRNALSGISTLLVPKRSCLQGYPQSRSPRRPSVTEIQQARANFRALAVRRDVDHGLQDWFTKMELSDVVLRLGCTNKLVASPGDSSSSSRMRR